MRASWAEFALKFTRGSAGVMEYRVCGADPNVVVDYVRILRDETAGSRPKIMPSVNAYTIVQAVAAAGTTWPGGAGDGTICESGYHVCNSLEAVTQKYTVDEVYSWGGQYLRTTGTFSWGPYTGMGHPHSGLIGYNDGGPVWNGGSSACPSGSAPMVYFEGNAHATTSPGHSWTGGCYADDSRNWACCLNLPEY